MDNKPNYANTTTPLIRPEIDKLDIIKEVKLKQCHRFTDQTVGKCPSFLYNYAHEKELCVPEKEIVMTTKKREKEKLTLCGYCKKPIHIDDFGGIQKSVGFFHSQCYLTKHFDKKQAKEILESLSDIGYEKTRNKFKGIAPDNEISQIIKAWARSNEPLDVVLEDFWKNYHQTKK